MEIISKDLKFNNLKKRKKTDGIIVHCTANKLKDKVTIEGIHNYHKSQGWAGIGYHYVIDVNGKVYAGRPEDCVGSHCSGYNEKYIGISTIGGLDDKGNPKDTRTPEQKESLYQLIDILSDKYNLSINDIYCHNNFNAHKACPSYDRNTLVSEYLAWLNKHTE